MYKEQGWGFPPEDALPIRLEELPYEAQMAILLFQVLPDKIEGMAGMWLGKDFSCLFDVMNIYEMINRIDIFDYLIMLIGEVSRQYSEQRKNEEKLRKK